MKKRILTFLMSGMLAFSAFSIPIYTHSITVEAVSNNWTINFDSMGGGSSEKDRLKIKVGQGKAIKLSGIPASSATFSSSNTSRFTVSKTGAIKCVGAGDAVITVIALDANSHKRKKKVYVTGVSDSWSVNYAKMGGGSRASDRLKIKIGTKKQINLIGLSAKKATFTSSNSSFTVSAKGAVKCVSNGNGIITVKSGNKTANVYVESTGSSTSFAVNTGRSNGGNSSSNPINIKVGEHATIYMDGYPSSVLQFTSNNPNAFEVSSTGNITCLGNGDGTITVEHKDKSVTTKTVTVYVHGVLEEKFSIGGKTITLTEDKKAANKTKTDNIYTYNDAASCIDLTGENSKSNATVIAETMYVEATDKTVYSQAIKVYQIATTGSKGFNIININTFDNGSSESEESNGIYLLRYTGKVADTPVVLHFKTKAGKALRIKVKCYYKVLEKVD